MNKFEKLIEYVINDEDNKAQDLFHEIVVEKSRDIYESLMDMDEKDEMGGDSADELINDISVDERGMNEDDDEEGLEVDDEEEGEMSDSDFNADGDMDAHEFDHEAGDAEDAELEDRVVDLEDQLDALMAEFDSYMSDDDMGMGAGPDDMGDGMNDEGGMDYEDDMGGEEEQIAAGMYENVSLSKVSKGISNSTEEGTVNKSSVNADNSGAKGAAAKPHQKTGEEGNVATPTAQDMGSTTEPNESRVKEPKKKGEDAGVNKKSLSGS